MPRGAIVKANYVRAGKGSKAKIRASGRYYTNRPDHNGDRTYRSAFNKEGDTLTKEELSTHLERAVNDHHYHYRMVLSPGAEAHTNGDLKAWTRDVMGEMELQHGGKLTWVAVEHAHDGAHTEHAHVHVIASTDRTLRRDELGELRTEATQSWERQMDYLRELERGRDLSLSLDRDREPSRDHEGELV